jgi:hypothetical protein
MAESSTREKKSVPRYVTEKEIVVFQALDAINSIVLLCRIAPVCTR